MSLEALVVVLNASSANWIAFHGGAEQRIFPALTFTCGGFVSKWLFVADEWGGSERIEMQIWRRNGTAPNLVKVGSYGRAVGTIVQLPGNDSSNLYQVTPSTPPYVQAGDVLGVYQPNVKNSSLALGYIKGVTGTENPSCSVGGQSISTLSLSSKGVTCNQTDYPLIFVEISK